jgi:hypothetical protein
MEWTYVAVPLGGMALGALGMVGWMFNNWLRARHGYPLTDDKGKLVHKLSDDVARQNELLSAENERLKAAMLRVEERVAVLERIATDSGTRVAREIDALR